MYDYVYVEMGNGSWNVWCPSSQVFMYESMLFDDIKDLRRNLAIEQADEETNSLLSGGSLIDKMSYEEWKEEYGWIFSE